MKPQLSLAMNNEHGVDESPDLPFTSSSGTRTAPALSGVSMLFGYLVFIFTVECHLYQETPGFYFYS